jgi:hypothetical protein
MSTSNCVSVPYSLKKAPASVISAEPDLRQLGIASMERHCSVSELARRWGFSENTIRRLFKREPGVLRIVHEATREKRRYTSMRIPERVAQRVHQRLQQCA